MLLGSFFFLRYIFDLFAFIQRRGRWIVGNRDESGGETCRKRQAGLGPGMGGNLTAGPPMPHEVHFLLAWL